MKHCQLKKSLDPNVHVHVLMYTCMCSACRVHVNVTVIFMSVGFQDIEKTSIKIILDRPLCSFSFFQYGHQQSSCTSRSTLFPPDYLGEVRRHAILIPPPDPSRIPPGWGWGRWAHSVPPANRPALRRLSKTVKKPLQSSLWLPCMLSVAPSLSPCKAVWSPTRLTYWELQILVKSVVNYFSRQIMGLSKCHDTLSQSFSTLVAILAMETFAVRFLWSAAAASHSPTLPFDNHL